MTFDELFFYSDNQEKSLDLVLKILENLKANSRQKSIYLQQKFSECSLMRNILELAILSYRTEFQKNEKRKFKNNMRGFFIGKERMGCYKCGKKMKDFGSENERIVIFHYCQHFVHFDCENGGNEEEEFICRICLKNKESENKKIKNKF